MPAHPTPTGKRLRSAYRCTLKYQSHEPEELCTFLLEGLKTPVENWSRSERDAIQEWKDWLCSWPELCKLNNDVVPSAWEMKKAIQLISTVFFCGKLDRCLFAWKKNMCYRPDGTTQPKPYLGLCHAPGAGASIEVRIDMDPADFSHLSGHQDDRSSKIGTLLHECVHAFIYLYCCTTNAHKACPLPLCVNGRCRYFGDSGHGTTFIQIATHIESLQKKLTDVGVYMSIPVSMGEEFSTSKTFVGVRPEDMDKCPPEYRSMLETFYQKSVASRGLIGKEPGVDELDMFMKSLEVTEKSKSPQVSGKTDTTKLTKGAK